MRGRWIVLALFGALSVGLVPATAGAKPLSVPEAVAHMVHPERATRGAQLLLGGPSAYQAGIPFGLNLVGQDFYGLVQDKATGKWSFDATKARDPDLRGYDFVAVWSCLGYAPAPPKNMAFLNERIPKNEAWTDPLAPYARIEWMPGKGDRYMEARFAAWVRSLDIPVFIYTGTPALSTMDQIIADSEYARDRLGCMGEVFDALSSEPSAARQVEIMTNAERIYGSRYLVACESWRVCPSVQRNWPMWQVVKRGEKDTLPRPDMDELVHIARYRLPQAWGYRDRGGRRAEGTEGFRSGTREVDEYGDWFWPLVVIDEAQPEPPSGIPIETNGRVQYDWSFVRAVTCRVASRYANGRDGSDAAR